jgi:ATP-dependent DNA helicase PIF1
MIMQQLAQDLPPGLPPSSIRHTPIDEAFGKDHIFTLAFPTLYPTGQADFNMPRVQKVALNNYARHLLCYRDGRFGCYPCWRFFVFNLLMRQKASTAAQFYVSKVSGLKDLDREELANALLTDDSLLSQIVQQGSNLTRIHPFWRNKSSHLYAQARFLSRDMSPVFITLSVADMQ